MKRSSIPELTRALEAATDPRDVLELAGRIHLLGGEIPAISIAIDLGIDELEEHAFRAIEASDIESLRRALAPRDIVELRRIGAQAILGRGPDLSLDEESSLIAFEEALRPHLWRLTAFNEWRALEVAWIPPPYRDRFWWWSEASDVDPRGALHLDAVAELIARFPEAEAALRKIATTDLLLRRPPAEIIDLGRWIRPRSPELAMAASTGTREQILLEHASFTLSFLPPDSILIDLLEPCGAHAPRLIAGAQTIESVPVPDAIERYRFDLDALARVTRADLVVALASGTVRVVLPPE